MKTRVRRNQTASESVRAHIERRLEFSLGRHAARILRTRVRIVDLNGPRGGEDKSCRIEVQLRPGGRIFVEDTDPDLYTAVDRAADRAGRAVSRAIERTRSIRHQTPAWRGSWGAFAKARPPATSPHAGSALGSE